MIMIQHKCSLYTMITLLFKNTFSILYLMSAFHSPRATRCQWVSRSTLPWERRATSWQSLPLRFRSWRSHTLRCLIFQAVKLRSNSSQKCFTHYFPGASSLQSMYNLLLLLSIQKNPFILVFKSNSCISWKRLSVQPYFYIFLTLYLTTLLFLYSEKFCIKTKWTHFE